MRWLVASEFTAKCNEDLYDPSVTSNHFTIHEFDRFVILLSTDEEFRTTLLDSGKKLTKGQLDRRILRDVFRTTKLAPALFIRL